MSKRTNVTISVTIDGETLTATQDYSEEFDHGHYRYAITDADGNIISVNSSIGGPCRGKLNISDVQKFFDTFIEERERFGS